MREVCVINDFCGIDENRPHFPDVRYPIVGTAVLTVALFLLSRLDEHTSTALMCTYFFLLGIALGLIIQVLVIAVQNAADYADLAPRRRG